jgi:hypothetical protein
MAMESNYGLMVLVMKDNGMRIKLTVEAYFIMLMEIFLMVNGRMIKQMVLELIIMRTAVNMKGIGLMIYKMARVKKLGKINQLMKATIRKVKNMDKEGICGAMVVFIMETGLIIKFKDLVVIVGLMVESTKAIGLIIKCMVMDT